MIDPQTRGLPALNPVVTDHVPDSDAEAFTVPERFARQVAANPNAPAIVTNKGTLTYDALDRLANRIAHQILTLFPAGQQRVALLLDHGALAIAAMLGVLKAGKIYVPLDPTYPETRTAYMIADVAAALLLADGGNREYAARLAGATLSIVDLDCLPDTLPEIDPALTIDSNTNACAYILYTSGSTGKPKGVLQTHRNLLHFISSYSRGLSIRADDRLSLFYSFSFSASLMDIYGALLSGATLYPYDLKNLGLNGLPAWLREQGITVYHSVPTVFRHLVDTLQASDGFPTIRAIDLGGEPVYRRDVEAFRRHFSPGSLLVNHLAFTEASVTAQYPIDHETPLLTDRVPVGFPADGVKVLILGDQGEYLGAEQVGELAVQSRYLSPGYWGQPDLTAAAFSPVAGAEERIYRTGDLGRILADGRVEHMGRKDARVKIRGYSVEVAEVEQALLRLDEIKEAAVIARDDEADEPRLVAYLVSACDPPPTYSMLRASLADVLPDYMLPSAVVMLDALPLNPNGKVNRRALPVPDAAVPISEAGFVAPRTPTEELLAQIWSRGLRVPAVSVMDSFLVLGGHSLLAMQIVSQIRSVLGIDLALREFFSVPTVAQLAAHLDLRRGERSAVLTSPIPPATTTMVSPMQRWLGYACAKDPQSPTYSTPFLLRLQGKLDTIALQRALQEIVMRHEPLRSAFAVEGVSVVLTILDRIPVDLPLQDLLELPKADRERHALTEAQALALRPFDLAADVLIRARLWRLDAEEHLLLLNTHHLVFDGWSQGVFRRELTILYNAFMAGTTIELPGLPLRYRDYAQWRQAWLESAGCRQQLDYWNQQLEGTPALLKLPTDRPRPDIRGNLGAQIDLDLSLELMEGLRQVSREAGVTLFMTLLAAWQVLLGRYSAQNDFVVFTPMAGRTRPETERLIGCFINMAPIRADLSGTPTVLTLLTRVRETMLDAFANQDVAMEQMRHVPRLQAMFVLQNTPDEEFRLNGIETSLHAVRTGTAMYELTLELAETSSGLHGTIEYDTDLYNEATMARMVGHLQTLLSALSASGPGVLLDSLDMLSAEERRQVESGETGPGVALSAGDVADHFAAQIQRAPDEAQLRMFLREKLPEYMIPSHFVWLDALPLTVGGKIDRKALSQAAPDLSSDGRCVAPQTHLEARLVAIWECVLGVRVPGVTDSFFAVGGHSLLAIRLLLEVEREFAIQLSLAALLQAPTIREMAALLQSRQQGDVQWTSLVPLQPRGSRPPLFCAPPGGGSVFFYRKLAAHIGEDQPLYTFEPRGMSGIMPPHETVEEAAAYYIAQIRTVQAGGPYFLCGLSYGGLVAFEMARQLESAGERIGLLVLFDTMAPGYGIVTASSDASVSGRTGRARLSQRMQIAGYSVGFQLENLSACSTPRERVVYVTGLLRRKMAEGVFARRTQRDRENPAALELPEAFNAVHQAEVRSGRAYAPNGYSGKVHLLRAHLQYHRKVEAPMGWDRLVKDLEVIEVPGTHVSMLDEPCVHVSIRHLHRLLAVAQSQALYTGEPGEGEPGAGGYLRRQLDDPSREIVGAHAARTPYGPLSLAPQQTSPPEVSLLHEFFTRTARRSPNAVAIDVPPGQFRAKRRTVPYAQVEQQSAALAWRMHSFVTEPCVVAILLRRDMEHLYCAQLAALQAGAAYLCIDPTFPDAQVRYLLEDSGAVALLTDRDGLARVAQAGIALPQICDVTVESPLAPSAPALPPAPWLTPDSPAYIIYTSGTTGRPKGVKIAHRSIVNLVYSDLDEFGLTPADRVAQGSSSAYDSSVEEIWLALAAGGTVVVMDDATVRLGPALVPWLRRERVTVLCPPPTLLRMMDCNNPEEALPDLHLLYVGGEALTRDVADRWARGRRMVNGYGPTECTVTALRADILPDEAISIGTPVPGLLAWALDENLAKVADDRPGELCLGGVGLAIGYHARPELTTEKFPVHPQYGRIYRTGDLVHRAPDGRFFYHGRMDTQVKLRGYRIELGEIEAVLAGHPAIQQVAVVAHEFPNGDTRLIAYAVRRTETNRLDV